MGTLHTVAAFWWLLSFNVSGWNALHAEKEIVRVYENLSLRGDKYYLNHFESLVKKDKNQKYGRGKLLARKNEDQDLKKQQQKRTGCWSDESAA